MVVVEVAVPRQVVDKGRDHIIRLECWRELHTIGAVKKHGLFPRRVLVLLDIIDGGILLSFHLDVLLAEPLAILASRLVIVNSREEGDSVVRWVRWWVVEGKNWVSRCIATHINWHRGELCNERIRVPFNDLSWRADSQHAGQAEVDCNAAKVAIEVGEFGVVCWEWIQKHILILLAVI